MPKLQWRTSEKGNPTTEIDGLRVTVFQQDGGWKYAIKDPLSERETYFSDLCESEDDAKERAINNVTADAPAVPFTKRQTVARLKDRSQVLATLGPKITESIDSGLTPDQLKRLHTLIEAHLSECEPLADAAESLDLDDQVVEAIEALIEVWDGFYQFTSEAVSRIHNLKDFRGTVAAPGGAATYSIRASCGKCGAPIDISDVKDNLAPIICTKCGARFGTLTDIRGKMNQP